MIHSPSHSPPPQKNSLPRFARRFDLPDISVHSYRHFFSCPELPAARRPDPPKLSKTLVFSPFYDSNTNHVLGKFTRFLSAVSCSCSPSCLDSPAICWSALIVYFAYPWYLRKLRRWNIDETWGYKHAEVVGETGYVCNWDGVDPHSNDMPTCVKGVCGGHNAHDMLPFKVQVYTAENRLCIQCDPRLVTFFDIREVSNFLQKSE